MSTFDPNKLTLSEDFYSVQCEGKSTGYPAYFVRLTHCNLSCGATMKFVNQFKKQEVDYDPGTFRGDLHANNKATWTCDTIPVWARGRNEDFDYLLNRWEDQGILEDINAGIIHVIWTGGEPTMPQHQESIVNFTEHAINKGKFMGWNNVNQFWEDGRRVYKSEPVKSFAYYEIETNGTFYIEDRLFKLLDQINCSPKLANSGMTEKQRIKPDAIRRIMDHPNYQFKFVISTEEDVEEFMRDFVIPFNIPLTNVVCMPGLDSQEDFHERTRFVLEMAKKYKFIGLTRLHVSAWDKTTGV